MVAVAVAVVMVVVGDGCFLGQKSNSLLTPSMKVDAVDISLGLVEADVVEALEAGALDALDAVVGHEEPFLPAHEDVGLGPPAGVGGVVVVGSIFHVVFGGGGGDG